MPAPRPTIVSSLSRRMAPLGKHNVRSPYRLMAGLAAMLAMLINGFAADNDLQPFDGKLNSTGAYVPVDLAPRANAHAPTAFPAELVTVGRIPFRVIPEAGSNHLFMKPIGWSAEKDETAEYPGYMAKYDLFPEPDDPTRAAFTIPVCDYSTVWLLAATDDDPALTENLTLRFGRFGMHARTAYHDFTAVVPRAGDQSVRAGQGNVVQIVPTPQGNLYLIKIPVTRTFRQDFSDYWEMHLDVTKQLETAVNLPDPYRFQLRPLGAPSGVRIYAMTLARPSLEMAVEATEPANVFNQPQKPTFKLTFRNHYEHYKPHHVEVVTRRDDGVEATFVFDEFRPWHPYHRVPTTYQEIILDLEERGHYEVTFNLYLGKTLISQRPTTLAILAPNTRQYRHESPFGTWDFEGTHTTPNDRDITGTLAVKAGWRYMFEDEKYGLESFNDSVGLQREAEKKAAEGAAYKPRKRALIFHETSISGPHVMRLPDVFTGKTYKMSDDEQKRFDLLWEQAHKAYAIAHEHFPEMDIYFGNGLPHLLEEFCRRGISKDYLRIAGNESGNYMRPPETQPPDCIANNAGLFMFRQILDHYGYTDTKIYQCYEMCYPNTNPGNLSYTTQANYYVRHIMHSLSWGVPKITLGVLTDMGNSYYHSHWGGSGFCFAYPNVSPKRSYVAYAVLTQVLDGASYQRPLDTGSSVVYALEFEKKDGDRVICLWTTHGQRPATLRFADASRVVLTSIYGRERPLALADGAVAITLSPEPLYLTVDKPVAAVELGTPVYADAPGDDAFLINQLDKLADWTVETERSYELETFNFYELRRAGDFRYREVAEVDGHEQVIGIRPEPVAGSEYLPMYSILALNQPVAIPGQPTELGLWVRGNGGWGRFIFELEDASGQRWISIGSEMSGTPSPWMADWMPKEQFEELNRAGGAGISEWNSNDAWGLSRINFDGWRFLRFPLPGNYGSKGDGYHWPRTSQWRFSGQPVVTYPLTFRKLIVTLPEKVLHLDRWAPVPNQEIFISGLRATHRPLPLTLASE